MTITSAQYKVNNKNRQREELMVMINFQLKMLERVLHGVEMTLGSIAATTYEDTGRKIDYNDPKRREEVDRHTRDALDRMGR